MASGQTPIGRGRGLGRGRGRTHTKDWMNQFKPNPPPISVNEICKFFFKPSELFRSLPNCLTAASFCIVIFVISWIRLFLYVIWCGSRHATYPAKSLQLGIKQLPKYLIKKGTLVVVILCFVSRFALGHQDFMACIRAFLSWETLDVALVHILFFLGISLQF